MTTSGLSKPPRQLLEGLFSFPPNRDTLGGTAYLLKHTDGEGRSANILIDAPAWNSTTQEFLTTQGVRWLVITHRGGIGQSDRIQAPLGCEIIIQEQEAYLLPQTPTTTFQSRLILSPSTRVQWTPGQSPGASCVYHQGMGGVLFTGRHLLPTAAGTVVPLRFAKTFHWPRQLRQVRALQQEFSADTLHYLCPGANTGYLRRKGLVNNAYEHLMAIDLEGLAQAPPLL
ncbi:MBL fold metallo-hydrolase [filamentous cyanobacterium CCP5]|nr:MBL fold metallo-hydrolase [filamentous cyanobacterium CCP5]